MVRYNTDTNVFEGYDGNWIALNGLYDLDPRHIHSRSNNLAQMMIHLNFMQVVIPALATKDRFDIPKLSVDDIEITGDTITTTQLMVI